MCASALLMLNQHCLQVMHRILTVPRPSSLDLTKSTQSPLQSMGNSAHQFEIKPENSPCLDSGFAMNLVLHILPLYPLLSLSWTYFGSCFKWFYYYYGRTSNTVHSWPTQWIFRIYISSHISGFHLVFGLWYMVSFCGALSQVWVDICPSTQSGQGSSDYSFQAMAS